MSSHISRTGRSEPFQSQQQAIRQQAIDTPSPTQAASPARTPSLQGLSPLSRPVSSAQGNMAQPIRRSNLREVGAAASPEVSRQQFMMKLVHQGVEDYTRALVAYPRTRTGITQVADHSEPLIRTLKKLADALKIAMGEAKQNLKSNTNERSSVGLLKRFSEELEDLNRECQSASDLVKDLGDVLNKFNPYLRKMAGGVSLVLNPNEPETQKFFEKNIKDISGKIARSRACFDTILAGIDRDMPSLRDVKIDGNSLDETWKWALKKTRDSHIKELLYLGRMADTVGKTLVSTCVSELLGRFGQLGEVINRTTRAEDRRTGNIGGGYDDRFAALLRESSNVGSQYATFAKSMDENLRWIDGLRGKPGIFDSIVLDEHRHLINAGMPIDTKAVILFDNIRKSLRYRNQGERIAGTADPAVTAQFDEVSVSTMVRISVELLHNVSHCLTAFPDSDPLAYCRREDAMRQPVLDAVALHCGEIETDLEWLRNSMKSDSPRSASSNEVDAAYEQLQVAVSRVRRNLQWNIATANAMRTSLARDPKYARMVTAALVTPSEVAVRDYTAKYLKGLAVPAPPEVKIPEIDWDDEPSSRIAANSGKGKGKGKGKKTVRQRQAIAESKRNQAAREVAREQELAAAKESLTQLCATPFDVKRVRQYAASLANLARTEADASGLKLLSGFGIYGKFMRAADALDKGRQDVLARIATIDKLIETLTDPDENGQAALDAKRMALPVRIALTQDVNKLSGGIAALRNEAAVQQKRRNLKLFAQKPSRELFQWLQKHDRNSLVSVSQTIRRKRLAGIAPNGEPHPHGDFLDEYVITLRDAQRIAYLDPGEDKPRIKTVTTVPLHVHYRSETATRPEACHFKNEPQSKVGGGDAYRSDDGVALMERVLEDVSKMAMRRG
ncbi:hypothetical protein GXB81_17850 [Paraburkholderia sp. Ac-20336]|uniref:hypothetical protein n=1 Tax=Paraburkholderia sp. Ac-20336 TaxID=2703886 RepID=UPI00197D867A|nr:hypothetical protein [Paraburkholderia sp. Ac-20336]MBN3804900.1 hypothetical protein [Paraburkholderia sp. Ac-20336]